jgi:quercetin dioxygenase-like cupin family protein
MGGQPALVVDRAGGDEEPRDWVSSVRLGDQGNLTGVGTLTWIQRSQTALLRYLVPYPRQAQPRIGSALGEGSDVMSNSEEPPLTVVGPAEGRQGALGSIGVVFKLFGTDTGGQLSIVEHPFPVGALVPPHIHSREDEYSIVTEGEIGFRSGDREVVLGAGGYITKPRGELHTMWNAGSEPARMIEVISPAGFEGFFWELADLIAVGPPEPESVAGLAESYGLTFSDPPWLPDIVARYNLNPPPGANRHAH